MISLVSITSLLALHLNTNLSHAFLPSLSSSASVLTGKGNKGNEQRIIRNKSILKNNIQHDGDNQEEEGDDGVDDDEPKYRSKLQRLNQVQNYSRNVNKMKKKTKLKHRKISPFPKPLSSSMSLGTTTFKDESPKLFSETGIPIDEDYAIDSFLRGEYDRPFSDEAPAPLPKHKPSEIVEIALRALRDLDIPTSDHGAAVFMRFCAPLSRFDRWGGNIRGAISPWKSIMRGSLTPTMLSRRLVASDEFSVLLDWEQLDVTEGTKAIPNEMLGYESTIAFVNAALFVGDGKEPSMCQFTLKMFNGLWLIDSAVMNKRELFMEYES